MKTPARTEIKTTEIDINRSSNLSSLKEKTGLLTRFGVARATSKTAGQALKAIEQEKVKAEANIALTAIKLSEAAIRASMVGSAMPQIGALATRVNAATTAVDQALTNGSSAEVHTHLANRDANLKLTEELLRSGKIDTEEAEVLSSFSRADAAEDIERSRQRAAEAKAAVSSLHSFALKGIEDAKDRIF